MERIRSLSSMDRILDCMSYHLHFFTNQSDILSCRYYHAMKILKNTASIFLLQLNHKLCSQHHNQNTEWFLDVKQFHLDTTKSKTCRKWRTIHVYYHNFNKSWLVLCHKQDMGSYTSHNLKQFKLTPKDMCCNSFRCKEEINYFVNCILCM